jgi:signal transduction histidine kinase
VSCGSPDIAWKFAQISLDLSAVRRAPDPESSLTVEDSGPDIVETERPRLFDRFNRVTEQGSGAGLGLATGDSIVPSAGGRWHIGDSSLGGALMMVTWKRNPAPHLPAARPPERPSRQLPSMDAGIAGCARTRRG